MADRESSSSVCGVPRSKWKVTVARSSLIKRRKQASSSPSECTSSQKQRTTGINPAWATEFTWMEICGNDGMTCTLCRKFSRRPQKCMPGRAVWVDLPCKTIRRASLIRGVGRIFMEGFLKRRARSACAKNSKPRPFLPVTAHYSNDLLAGLQRKRSKNNQNSAVLWL